MDFDDLDREEVDRRFEDAGDLEAIGQAFVQAQACPGIWRITGRTFIGCQASQTGQANNFLDDLRAGSIVKVLQMKHLPEEHTVRGRLEHPFGWITLFTTWNEEASAELLEEATSGVYEITNTARVTTTLSLLPSDGCKDVADLYEQTLVRVLEVQLSSDERRIRGRIEHPYEGWISLFNTENGYRWAERREKGTEAPLLSLEGLEPGDTLRLLSDVDALTDACQELGSLTPEQCLIATGAELTVLERDLRYKRVRCQTPLFGDEWFAMSCFVYTPSGGVADDEPEVEAEGAGSEEPRSAPAAPRPRVARASAPARQVASPATAIVQASPEPPPQPAEPEPTEAEARAVAELLRSSRPAPAEKKAPAPPKPRELIVVERDVQPSKDFYTLEDFPVGRVVEISDSMALRSGETSLSREIKHLDKGLLCVVLEHSETEGSRRMRVREARSQLEGWISCATKAGRPLVALTAAVEMPSVSEVLAKVDEDSEDDVDKEQEEEEEHDGAAIGAHRMDAEEEPEDPVLRREKAEEAVAVWRGYSDLARLDTPDELRGIEEAQLSLEVRRHELVRWGGWDNPATEQVTLSEDRRLRIMEEQLVKREERNKTLKDRLQRAMQKQMAGARPMPKSRAIVRRNAPLLPGPLGSASSSSQTEQHLAIEDMRLRLAEERLESLEDPEAASGLPLEPSARGAFSRGFADQAAQAAARRAGAEPPGATAEEAHADPEDADGGDWEEGPHIEPGSLVRVEGLKGASDLNGLEGMVERWDEKTERWVVRLQNGQCKKLRDHNLLLAEDPAYEEGLDDVQEEAEGGMEAFGGAPFAVSMRHGREVLPPKGFIQPEEQRPWYAPWMVDGK